jgi:hypothetical protein
MCASGETAISSSRLPAGTTSKAPSIWTLGKADPQTEQKLLACRVAGTWYCVIFSFPECQTTVAVDENRFDACADPVSFRQRLQWQR